jgi:hypothetical protein
MPLRKSLKEFNNQKLELEVFGTTQNLTLTASLLKLLNVDTETVFSMLSASKESSDSNDKAVLIVDSILTLTNKIELEKVVPVLKELVSKVYIDGKVIDFDDFFSGDNELLVQVLMWVVEENRFFGKSFISKMQTAAEGIKQDSLKTASEEQIQN